MKVLFSLLILSSFTFSCATYTTYSQLLVDAGGNMYRCSSWGHGYVGTPQAKKIQRDCLSDMKGAGYIEIEKAGVVGLYLSEQSPTDMVVTVLKIVPNSPADKADIRGGDKIAAIDGQPVKHNMDAKILLFGIAGTPVRLTLLRGDESITKDIIRASYVSVFGMPKE
jgi:C-terminal processing protease CtpA/Prc